MAINGGEKTKERKINPTSMKKNFRRKKFEGVVNHKFSKRSTGKTRGAY